MKLVKSLPILGAFILSLTGGAFASHLTGSIVVNFPSSLIAFGSPEVLSSVGGCSVQVALGQKANTYAVKVYLPTSSSCTVSFIQYFGSWAKQESYQLKQNFTFSAPSTNQTNITVGQSFPISLNGSGYYGESSGQVITSAKQNFSLEMSANMP